MAENRSIRVSIHAPRMPSKHLRGTFVPVSPSKRIRLRAERAYNRLNVSRKDVAEALDINPANASRKASSGGYLYKLALEVNALERAGIDTTPLLTFLAEVQATAKANALTDDELLQKLHTAILDECEAEAVENKSALAFMRSGCFHTLVEGTASENAVQTKVTALASAAVERNLKWRGA